jgi:hypothetical protein
VQDIIGFTEYGWGSRIPLQSPLQNVESLMSRNIYDNFAVTTNPIAADINGDGYPEIIVGSENHLVALDRNFTLVADFPKRVDDRYPDADVTAAPIVADIRRGGQPEVIASTEMGNVYAYGDELAYGFPLSGGEFTAGSALFVNDSLCGKLGYIGADGWFYLWQMDTDTTRNFWPMAGGNAGGTLVFDESRLGDPAQYATGFDEKQFFNYPNPVTEGRTTIRYFLGAEAARVTLTVFDLSGVEIAEMNGPGAGGVTNEYEWNCGDVTPGVYRCRIEVDFGGGTETAFTDIAILR